MINKLPIQVAISIIALVILTIVSAFAGVYEFEKDTFTILKFLIFERSSLSLTDFYVLFDLRIPRIIMAILVGSLLAFSGTCLQGIFRNPLATPDLIGISSGATLFAAISIVLGSFIKPFINETIQFYLVSIMAFFGALIASFLVFKVATFNNKTNIAIMLLTGIAISALGFSFTGFLIYLSKEEQLRDLTFWNLGSLAAASWGKNIILGLILIVSYVLLINKGKLLNAMMLGEQDAKHLGFNVEKTKKRIIWLVALMVGATVAFSGTIGFVGLVIPYILRLIFHSNYQMILPLSAIYGAILLLGADTISRTLVAPSEIPIGVLTACIGAPVFISILIKQKKSLL